MYCSVVEKNCIGSERGWGRREWNR